MSLKVSFEIARHITNNFINYLVNDRYKLNETLSFENNYNENIYGITLSVNSENMDILFSNVKIPDSLSSEYILLICCNNISYAFSYEDNYLNAFKYFINGKWFDTNVFMQANLLSVLESTKNSLVNTSVIKSPKLVETFKSFIESIDYD